jgi:hypothetical protein
MTDVHPDDDMQAEQSDQQELSDAEELLHRQVHPSWVDDGQPSSQAFRPTPKDEGMLSIACASLSTAAEAFEHHTQTLGLLSAGTWAVSVGEVSEVGLTAYADPLPDQQAHGLVDFRTLGRKAAETKSRILRARAHQRGRLHPN